jgi:glycosyltransferase involved in cell wall biosynthesis
LKGFDSFMIILIPAYEPTNRMITLIKNLKDKCDYPILIVDDGSGSNYKNIFDTAEEMGCLVLTQEKNKGKGDALKLGFEFIQVLGQPHGIVTADCDGQHLPDDIIKIAKAVDENPNTVILGCRRFTGTVPFRSRFGNSITRGVFAFASGVKVYDTQTGLRGYSSSMINWLCEVPGHRFEYEMNQLLEASFSGYEIKEIDIDTVYLEENKSSHFRTISL